jgi:hypothetical protein
MNQSPQNLDFTPMLFRQKAKGMGGGVGALQEVAQRAQSNVLYMAELTVPGISGLKLFGQMQSSQPWVYRIEFEAPANVTGSANSPQNAELNWLREHAEETAAYVGQWLLISGDTLLTHSQNFDDIKTAIVAQNISSPFVYYVPTVEESSFVML